MLKRLAQNIRALYLKHRIRSAWQDIHNTKHEQLMAPQRLALIRSSLDQWLTELRQIDETAYRHALGMPPLRHPTAPPQSPTQHSATTALNTSRRLDSVGDRP